MMPDPPSVGLFTRYLFENPWPAGLFTLAAALTLAWIGLREGRTNRLKAAGVFAVISAAVFITAAVITTPGEHGERVTRQFVDTVAEGRIDNAIAMLSPNATLALESPASPGLDRDFLTSAMRQLEGRYRIDSHYVTRLDGYEVHHDEAEVHLVVFATSSGYTSKSAWVIRVRRQTDNDWKIDRITCIAINDRPPQLQWFR